MSRFISYAQNFEDLILWRALGHIERGAYLDVGAQDPCIDSVSLAFYERGWRGMHIEPSKAYAAALREARPDEEVVEAAVGTRSGTLSFYEIPASGLSTGDAAIAERHRAAGLKVRETEVQTCTLDDVLRPLENSPIHWMKIDVEGMELDVLRSWKGGVRPWIVVIESTEPNSPTQSHEQWEAEILGKGYDFVYFDGLNRFYVSAEHPELKVHFLCGPNVFDDFALSGTAQSPFCALVNEQRRAAEAQTLLLQERLTLVETDVETLCGKLGSAEAEEGALRAKIAAMEDDARTLCAKIATMEEDAGTLRAKIAADDAMVARAEARNAWLSQALERRERDIALIVGSRSWVLTSPLRAANRRLAGAVLAAKGVGSTAVYRAWLMLRRTHAKAAFAALIACVPPLRARLERIVTRELGKEPRAVRMDILGLSVPVFVAQATRGGPGKLTVDEILARVEREVNLSGRQ